MMTSDYGRLRGLFADHAETEPSTDEGRQQILEAITEGRTASFVSEAEQVRSLAALGYGRAAVAEALDLTPDEVDELARDALGDLQRKLGGGA